MTARNPHTNEGLLHPPQLKTADELKALVSDWLLKTYGRKHEDIPEGLEPPQLDRLEDKSQEHTQGHFSDVPFFHATPILREEDHPENAGRQLSAQRLGAIRHARQCLGVVF